MLTYFDIESTYVYGRQSIELNRMHVLSPLDKYSVLVFHISLTVKIHQEKWQRKKERKY